MIPRWKPDLILFICFFLSAASGLLAAQSYPQDAPQGAAVTPEMQRGRGTMRQVDGPEPPDAPSTFYSSSKNHGNIDRTVMLTNDNWRPLTTKQKFDSVRQDMLCPFTQLSLLGGAGVSQWTNDRAYLGQGFAGFAKRYGLDNADTLNNDFIEGAFLPWMFHEDPRYIPRDAGSRKRRAAYALSRTVIARHDDGTDGLNRSKLLGAFATSALSNVYYPSDRDRSLGATSTRALIGLGTDGALNLVKEFWPDIARKVKMKVWMANTVERALRAASRADD